jgi:hypothetical protein
MTLQRPVGGQRGEIPAQVTQGEPPLGAGETIQRQLEQQARLLQALHLEIIALRETQSAYHVTLTKLEKQMRWARWVRRVRGAIFGLFWLGVAAILAYYWQDLSTLWNDWSRFIL